MVASMIYGCDEKKYQLAVILIVALVLPCECCEKGGGVFMCA